MASEADAAASTAQGTQEIDADAARRQRIADAVAKGEAPIKPEFLVGQKSSTSASSSTATAAPAKRTEDGANKAAEATAPGAGDEAAANADVATVSTGNGTGDDRSARAGGKGDGKGDGQPEKKKRRGMNKSKDRAVNSEAMRMVRASQICSRLAYVNRCETAEAGEGGQQKCKHSHDLDAFFSAKPASIGEPCPVLAANGVCPAGLNCRFDGHIKDRKNVDRDGTVLATDSPWLATVPGVGQPRGETNIFKYELVGQLRRKVYDFSRSQEVAKAWQRYCSGASGPPLGAIVETERRPIDLKGKRILAPLTTVGNLPFRRLCMRLGCEVTVGEMALASSILDGSPTELSLFRRHESETCYGIQIAGGDVEMMTKLAQFVDEQVDCDFVDINCGCPLDEVHRRGAGSRLMARSRCLEGVVRCMSNVLKTKPLTLKMRTADHEDRKSTEFDGRYAHKLVPQLEEWGVSALTLHGRTARQRYSKLADWGYMQECSTRRSRSTPFVGCGDVLSWEEAEDHLKNHGVDSIMLGRGALIKPWLFTEMAEKRDWDISANERFDLVRDFTNYGLEHWGADARGVETTRRFLLEWLSFTSRYVPLGILEQLPPKINWRPRAYVGRNDLETKLGSSSAKDWIEITEMLLGKVPEGFVFVPKHKSASYDNKPAAAAAS